jgi:hypothetical protein
MNRDIPPSRFSVRTGHRLSALVHTAAVSTGVRMH